MGGKRGNNKNTRNSNRLHDKRWALLGLQQGAEIDVCVVKASPVVQAATRLGGGVEPAVPPRIVQGGVGEQRNAPCGGHGAKKCRNNYKVKNNLSVAIGIAIAKGIQSQETITRTLGGQHQPHPQV